ncbi:DUF7919 family protein [Streptomyces sp. NPDC002666]
MTHYADLTPYTYDRNWATDATGLWHRIPLFNVGWLDRGQPFEKGDSPRAG